MPEAQSKGMSGHQRAYRGNTYTWLTPPEILRSLGPFDLDPCCPSNMPWTTAATMLTAAEDGFSAKWRGRVWLNPPYGPQTTKWLARLSEHNHGTALIFARTETDAWHRFVWERASAILFLRGRLHFHRQDGSRASGNAGAPSALAAYGSYDAWALKASGINGKFIVL